MLCNVRNDFLSNLEVEVRIPQNPARYRCQEAGVIANFVDDLPAIVGIIAAWMCLLLHRGGGGWAERWLIVEGAEFRLSMTCSCSDEGFEYTIYDMRDTVDVQNALDT